MSQGRMRGGPAQASGLLRTHTLADESEGSENCEPGELASERDAGLLDRELWR
jgi:hypothetical protein